MPFLAFAIEHINALDMFGHVFGTKIFLKRKNKLKPIHETIPVFPTIAHPVKAAEVVHIWMVWCVHSPVSWITRSGAEGGLAGSEEEGEQEKEEEKEKKPRKKNEILKQHI